MKLAAVNLAGLVAVAALAVSVGYGPTTHRWGPAGVTSMWAATVICLSAAFAAALGLVVIALRRPAQVGMAALAATVIRLLLTMLLSVAYQLWADVHLPSFLSWLLILYLLLLGVELVVSVVLVRARWRPPTGTGR